MEINRHGTRHEDVPLEQIGVPEGHRHVDEVKVAALAESIKELGLLQRVGLTTEYRLIYGGHRLAAHRLLGRERIPAVIHDFDELHRQMAEIDENIERNTLTVLQEAKALAQRKEIYETLHPETKAVTKRGGPGRGKRKTNDRMSPVSFTKDTAAKIRKDCRTVERRVKLGNDLDDEAASLLKNTPFANTRSELTKLSKLAPDIQRQVAKELARGQARNVAEAVGQPPKDLGQPASDSTIRAAKRGLKGLGAVVQALKACGIFARHEGAVRALKETLEQRAEDFTDNEASEPDDEVGEWRA